VKYIVFGEAEVIEEFKDSLTSNNELDITYFDIFNPIEDLEDFTQFDVIFDLSSDEMESAFLPYEILRDNQIIILNTVKTTLSEIKLTILSECNCQIFGINALPTFLGNKIKEVSILFDDNSQIADIHPVFEPLGWKYTVVKDRVGLVSARILFMIINEAFYTLEEGTSTKEDINIAMKLGTNYPKGPFEWVDEIGIEHIYEVLDAMQKDSHDDRYKICNALKSHYLKKSLVNHYNA